MLIDVKSVAVLDSQKQEIGSASGDAAVRLVLKDFAERGEGKVLVFSSPAGEKVSLVMSHGGYLQIEYP